MDGMIEPLHLIDQLLGAVGQVGEAMRYGRTRQGQIRRVSRVRQGQQGEEAHGFVQGVEGVVGVFGECVAAMRERGGVHQGRSFQAVSHCGRTRRVSGGSKTANSRLGLFPKMGVLFAALPTYLLQRRRYFKCHHPEPSSLRCQAPLFAESFDTPCR